ncbi:DUF1127 domain-containing protein [Celeribacter litoreus]|uniref:DUF1127 domain-containing protein n=1 Tax=Celeribacter litoreus TaxID=2876714 RepID=UPI001CCCBCD1|nr:DUF1127 domain-containing protein [Celeribacter litoreus]MCA0045314.1 DUF1127 domain-containing protein [Celeribacter litoreus]
MTHTAMMPANFFRISPALNARLDLFFTNLGVGPNAYAVRRKRLSELARLDSMSDEALADLGVTRDRIPHYVFQDMFCV